MNFEELVDDLARNPTPSNDEKLRFLQSLYTVLNNKEYLARPDKDSFPLPEKAHFDTILEPYFDDVDQKGVKDPEFNFISMSDEHQVAQCFKDLFSSTLNILDLLPKITDKDLNAETEVVESKMTLGAALSLNEGSLHRCGVTFELSTDGNGREKLLTIDTIGNPSSGLSVATSTDYIPLKYHKKFVESIRAYLPGRFQACEWIKGGNSLSCSGNVDVEDAYRFCRDFLITPVTPGGDKPEFSTFTDGTSLRASNWKIIYDHTTYAPNAFVVFMRNHLD